MKSKPSFYVSMGAVAFMGALLTGTSIAATPAMQAQADSSMPAPAMKSSADTNMSKKTHIKLSPTDRAEIRIKDLHSKLKIAPGQETQWAAVAQAMRDNAVTMEDLAEKRKADASGMNAVDDLKSYAEIAQAHADGVKNFIPAFEALYNTLSDQQKATADALFEHKHHGGKMKKEAPAGK